LPVWATALWFQSGGLTLEPGGEADGSDQSASDSRTEKPKIEKMAITTTLMPILKINILPLVVGFLVDLFWSIFIDI